MQFIYNTPFADYHLLSSLSLSYLEPGASMGHSMEEGVELPYDPCPRPLDSERGSEEHELPERPRGNGGPRVVPVIPTGMPPLAMLAPSLNPSL